MKQILIYIIKLYRLIISPCIGTHCRFQPTCSAYTMEAIQKFGCFKGVYLGVKRLLKCHPWHEGGFDPVPVNKSEG